MARQELTQLITGCQREQTHGEDSGCCFELARRGLAENDGPTWEAFKVP